MAADADRQKVEVTVAWKAGTLWACPEGRERLPVPPGPELAEGHDHVEFRWRHLDTWQFETVLVSPGAEAALGRRQRVDGAGALSAAEWARAVGRGAQSLHRAL